jgi:hypothetical protein
MYGWRPVRAPTEEPEVKSFAEQVGGYRDKLQRLLSESPWAPWKPTTWTSGRWARSDPELRKVLQRLYGVADEVLRIHLVAPSDDGSDRWGFSDQEQRRVLDLFRSEPSELRLDSGLELFDAVDRLMIEIGDARYVCAEVEAELLMNHRATTYVRWADLFGAATPGALAAYNHGRTPSDGALDEARSMLASLRRVRADDYQVHRARQRMRSRNLHILSCLLLPVVVALGFLMVPAGEVPAAQVALVAVSGATGSIVAGTMKARDKLVRGSDLRAFRSGIVAQVLVGAGAALFLMLILESGAMEFGSVEPWAGQAVAGFVAGFSEPFLLRTVERVARLGTEEPAPETTQPRQKGWPS